MNQQPNIYKDGKLRADLRAAVLAYTSKTNYAWDDDEQRVRPATADDNRILPKIDRSIVTAWRSEFADFLSLAPDDDRAAKLSEWVEGTLPSKRLPTKFRKLWSDYLTQAISEHLELWIEENDDSPNAIQDFIDTGDNLSAGELYLIKARDADEQERQHLFANACAHWASPGPIPKELQDIAALIQSVDRFVPELIVVATIHVIWRLQELNIEAPSLYGDFVYRLIDTIRDFYSLAGKPSVRECVSGAIAQTEREFSELTTRVNSFSRSTAVTAKGPSIAVLKQMHRYSKLALPAERALLRDIDVLVGPIFRKFCEGCERRQPDVIASRGAELRAHIQRLLEFVDVDAPSQLTKRIIVPTIRHVTSLIDEGTARGEAQSAPHVEMVGDTIKLDMSTERTEAVFLARLRNDGNGKASGVRIVVSENQLGGVVSFCDDFARTDIEAGAERIVRLKLDVEEPSRQVSVPLSWTCMAANGRTYQFDQTLLFVQQNKQPNWESLAANPPYAINPIKRREDLYGRDTILNDLTLHIASGTSTFLWGQKRVGKTSILQVLAAEINQQANRTCFVLRMGELASMLEGQIAHAIASRIAEAHPGRFEVPPVEYFGAGMGGLVPLVEKICESIPNQNFTIIIDEFDDLDPAFYTGERGKQFVKALRSLSEVGLTFFFVGSERMDAIYTDHASDLNKWINISLDRIISEDDCMALIVEPVSDAIEYEAEAARQVIEYCDGNPFYMHLLCSAIFRRCWQEKRTFVGTSDLAFVRRELLRTLSQINFAHFWEDNPVLSIIEKRRQSAENCLFLACVTALGGAYGEIGDLKEAQESLQLSVGQRLPATRLREVEARMLRRKVVVGGSGPSERVQLRLPMFADWLFENAESQLLPIWCSFWEEQEEMGEDEPLEQMSLIEMQPFPISEDELLSVSEKLVFLGKQVDVAVLRRWLRQFDDDSRIEVAYLLLKRLAERGFVTQGAINAAFTQMQESISARRLQIGSGKWNVIRGRLDNLCITYVDSDIKSGAVTARELGKRMRPGKCSSSMDLRPWIDGHADKDPIIVFADDFSGSGNTLVKGLRRCWKSNENIMSKLAAEGRIFCCLQSAFPEATQQLSKEFPDVHVLVMKVFDDDLRAFDEGAEIFSDDGERQFAKDVLVQIGRQLQPQHPLGYEDMGVLVGFHNTTPNNTLPVFWCDGSANNRKWRALLPRASLG